MSSASPSPDHFYRPFVDLVKKSVRGAMDEQVAQRLLNGAAADEVHLKIPRALRAKDGIFFSGHFLAQEAALLARSSIEKGQKIFDPACGAGDLLLAVAKLLPLEGSIEETLVAWGRVLGGTDLHQAFVDATKWRLALLAKNRHNFTGNLGNIKISEIFQGIQKSDYLNNPMIANDYDCVIVNPPFGHKNVDDDCTWSTGRTQLAAIFMDKILQHRKSGQIIVAILPDVLRGGTRYKRWREIIQRKATITATHVYGRFEKRTDVDVFLSRIECNEIENILEAVDSKESITRVENLFSIKVGSVVPHRHAEKGPWRPYLKVSNAPANGETRVISSRRYSGTCFQTPFLVIRRTSNPSDKNRLICTVVTGPELIAVENHLIVAIPKSKKIEECRQLAAYLSSPHAIEHINNQIRCRHLTTGALKSIPLPNWKD